MKQNGCKKYIEQNLTTKEKGARNLNWQGKQQENQVWSSVGSRADFGCKTHSSKDYWLANAKLFAPSQHFTATQYIPQYTVGYLPQLDHTVYIGVCVLHIYTAYTPCVMWKHVDIALFVFGKCM